MIHNLGPRCCASGTSCSSKPDWANPKLSVKFFISIYDRANYVKLNEETPGPFVWFSTLQCRRFGRESVSYSGDKVGGKFRLKPLSLIELPGTGPRLFILSVANRVRLVGDVHGSGRVEVFDEGEWGTICGKNWKWTLNEAMVVCKELGFKKAIFQSRMALHGQGTGPVLLRDVACEGTERSLLECPKGQWGDVGDCRHDEDVGVSCLSTGQSSSGFVQDSVSG